MRSRIANLTILEIEALLECAEDSRRRMENQVSRLEEENKDLKRRNEILKENLIAEQSGVNEKLRSLQEQVASISIRLPVDIKA